jgi:hypothetical protein
VGDSTAVVYLDVVEPDGMNVTVMFTRSGYLSITWEGGDRLFLSSTGHSWVCRHGAMSLLVTLVGGDSVIITPGADLVSVTKNGTSALVNLSFRELAPIISVPRGEVST